MIGETVFKMHTGDDVHYEFVYCGCKGYVPNKSTHSGYGSDDWYYLCKVDEEICILHFEVNGAYGFGCWDCAMLEKGAEAALKEANEEQWIEKYAVSTRRIRRLKLDDIDAVRHILPKVARIGALEDHHYSGF